MGFFHQEKNVNEYIKMAEGYDGLEIIEELQKYLPRGSLVLELGMGPGIDLNLLKKHYQVTGSDYSEVFIKRYRKQDPNADLIMLDAITLNTDRKFKALYSNKVLMHLTREELKQSIKRQTEILEPNGIICHSFWHGEKEENFDGLLFIYYTTEQLRTLFKDSFDIIKIEIYQEMEPNDSLFIIGKKI